MDPDLSQGSRASYHSSSESSHAVTPSIGEDASKRGYGKDVLRKSTSLHGRWRIIEESGTEGVDDTSTRVKRSGYRSCSVEKKRCKVPTGYRTNTWGVSREHRDAFHSERDKRSTPEKSRGLYRSEVYKKEGEILRRPVGDQFRPATKTSRERAKSNERVRKEDRNKMSRGSAASRGDDASVGAPAASRGDDASVGTPAASGDDDASVGTPAASRRDGASVGAPAASGDDDASVEVTENDEAINSEKNEFLLTCFQPHGPDNVGLYFYKYILEKAHDKGAPALFNNFDAENIDEGTHPSCVWRAKVGVHFNHHDETYGRIAMISKLATSNKSDIADMFNEYRSKYPSDRGRGAPAYLSQEIFSIYYNELIRNRRRKTLPKTDLYELITRVKKYADVFTVMKSSILSPSSASLYMLCIKEAVLSGPLGFEESMAEVMLSYADFTEKCSVDFYGLEKEFELFSKLFLYMGMIGKYADFSDSVQDKVEEMLQEAWDIGDWIRQNEVFFEKLQRVFTEWQRKRV
jgi:hypothetical protein